MNNEIAALLEDIRTREKFSLIIFASISTFIYSSSLPTSTIVYVKFLPLACSLIMALSVWAIYKRVGKMGEYLFGIETQIFNPDKYKKMSEKMMGKEKKGWERKERTALWSAVSSQTEDDTITKKENSFENYGWERYDTKRSWVTPVSAGFWALQFVAGFAFLWSMSSTSVQTSTNKPIQIMAIERQGQSTIDTVIIHSHSSKK